MTAEALERRAALYHLFGGLLLECAAEATLREIAARGVLLALAEEASGDVGDALRRMHAALAEGSIEPVRTDHALLFLGGSRDGAPPFESVHRSADRMVWQGPAESVLRAYARAGLGYDDMTSLPPDHVGRELLFLATLDVASLSADDDRAAELSAARRSFLDEHVLSWVPGFLAEVRGRAATPFYQALADGLDAQLRTEVVAA